jgi:hypothetical protein
MMLLMAVLLFEGQVVAKPPAPLATINGVVFRATTGEPIAGAQVTIMRAAPGSVTSAPNVDGVRETPPQAQSAPAQPPQALIVPAVTTDERGRFEIKDVAQGAYRLIAARNGFSKQEYGQRSANQTGAVLNIAGGQRVTGIEFRLSPAGTIMGRVSDARGEPLAGVTVQALRSTYDASGKRTLQPAASGRTNDLGEYRLYWINPGRYYISANPARSTLDILASNASQTAPANSFDAQAMGPLNSILGAIPNPNEVPVSGFPLTFFPGTQDVSGAVSIDLQPGAESRADFTLVRSERFRIRGRIIDGRTNRPPQSASVSISPRNGIAGGSIFDSIPGIGNLQGNQYSAATGEFEVRDVMPGPYWLQVMTQPSFAAAAGQVAPAPSAASVLSSMASTQIPVDVSGADIENMNLTVSTGISISGRLRMDSNEPLPRVSLLFQPTSRGPSFLSLMTGRVQPSADGIFSIPGITPGEYKLLLTGLPPDVYVKEARLENRDPLEGLTVSDRVDGSLDITLSTKSGQLDGAVTNTDGKPVVNVQAVLVPERLRNRQDLYKTATTNQDGRFNMRGIAPGDYRLFVWEDLEPFAYFDPDLLKQYEPQGRLIHIQEASRTAVEAKLIPASR